MATLFKKGDAVRLNITVPTGPVKALRMDEEGTVYCLIEWSDKDGQTQERWFDENDLVAAGA